jgi:hypothetical protein
LPCIIISKAAAVSGKITDAAVALGRWQAKGFVSGIGTIC